MQLPDRPLGTDLAHKEANPYGKVLEEGVWKWILSISVLQISMFCLYLLHSAAMITSNCNLCFYGTYLAFKQEGDD